MEQFKLQDVAKKAETLFAEARKALKSNSDADIVKRADEVPAKLSDEDSKIRIAFVGQYSAGKSSILSLLTGQELEVGGGVTTQTVTELDWHGLTVLDTPGVLTQNRPDHDAITYDALAKADLIVFVVPSDGFSGHVGEHFQELAITRRKAAEMMLVVNKMDETAAGNTPEQQAIVFDKNIAPVIAPYTREGMYTSFLISNYWKKGLKATGDRQAEYLRRSGRDQFINSLNSFVADKHVMGKTTTNLHVLEQLLTDILSKQKTGDECADGVREILTRQRRALMNAKESVRVRASNLIRRDSAVVSGYGDAVASSITEDFNEQDIRKKVEQYQEKTNEVYGNAVKKLEKIIEEENDGIDREFQDIAKSPTSQFVCHNIAANMGSVNIDPATMRKMGSWANNMGKFGQNLAHMAKGGSATGTWQNFFKVSEASGSQAHTIVLKVGHLFGHKFVPWEATKYAARIGQLGKILGALGAVLGVIGQIVSDAQEEERERELAGARRDIRASFNGAEDAINMQFDENTQTWVEQNYDPAIREIDAHLKEIEAATMKDKSDYQTLIALRDKTRALIAEAQEA